MFKKTLITIHVCFVTIPAFADAFDDTVRDHGNWSSFSVRKGVWSAAVNDNQTKDNLFGIHFTNNDVYFRIMTVNLSYKQIRSWDNSNRDVIKIKVRIDNKQITETNVIRILDRENGTLIYQLPRNIFGKNFIHDLKRGSVLKIREYVNNNAFTTTYSLNGATAAINRAMSRAKKSERSRGRRMG